jgi:hypothetical protein
VSDDWPALEDKAAARLVSLLMSRQAKKRWSKASKAEKAAHIEMMNEARAKKAKRRGKR